MVATGMIAIFPIRFRLRAGAEEAAAEGPRPPFQGGPVEAATPRRAAAMEQRVQELPAHWLEKAPRTPSTPRENRERTGTTQRSLEPLARRWSTSPTPAATRPRTGTFPNRGRPETRVC